MMSVLPGPGRLIAGTSGSPGSLPALRYARDLPRRNDVPLLAVLAWVPPGGDLAERRYPSAHLRGLWADAARQRLTGALDAAWGGVPPDLDITAVVIRGEPGPALVEAADCGDDLLVVGAGRRGALTRMWHAKVSRYCLSHALCPVLAVPPPTARQMGLGPAGWALRHRELTLDQALRDWDAAAWPAAPAEGRLFKLSPVFSIVIVALTLTSTQFGPRMLRNFIRDRGTQVTLGTFVATFVYAVLALGAIGQGGPGFVPHISITVTLALMVADLGVLIYFLHHITTQIQLPQVIAGIAGDLAEATELQAGRGAAGSGAGSAAQALAGLDMPGGDVAAPRSGYLQYIQRRLLVRLASELGVVIHLRYRPGHFLVQGHAYATVWPAEAARRVAQELSRAHVTGPYRGPFCGPAVPSARFALAVNFAERHHVLRDCRSGACSGCAADLQ